MEDFRRGNYKRHRRRKKEGTLYFGDDVGGDNDARKTILARSFLLTTLQELLFYHFCFVGSFLSCSPTFLFSTSLEVQFSSAKNLISNGGSSRRKRSSRSTSADEQLEPPNPAAGKLSAFLEKREVASFSSRSGVDEDLFFNHTTTSDAAASTSGAFVQVGQGQHQRRIMVKKEHQTKKNKAQKLVTLAAKFALRRTANQLQKQLQIKERVVDAAVTSPALIDKVLPLTTERVFGMHLGKEWLSFFKKYFPAFVKIHREMMAREQKEHQSSKPTTTPRSTSKTGARKSPENYKKKNQERQLSQTEADIEESLEQGLAKFLKHRLTTGRRGIVESTRPSEMKPDLLDLAQERMETAAGVFDATGLERIYENQIVVLLDATTVASTTFHPGGLYVVEKISSSAPNKPKKPGGGRRPVSGSTTNVKMKPTLTLRHLELSSDKWWLVPKTSNGNTKEKGNKTTTDEDMNNYTLTLSATDGPLTWPNRDWHNRTTASQLMVVNGAALRDRAATIRLYSDQKIYVPTSAGRHLLFSSESDKMSAFRFPVREAPDVLPSLLDKIGVPGSTRALLEEILVFEEGGGKQDAKTKEKLLDEIEEKLKKFLRQLLPMMFFPGKTYQELHADHASGQEDLQPVEETSIVHPGAVSFFPLQERLVLAPDFLRRNEEKAPGPKAAVRRKTDYSPFQSLNVHHYIKRNFDPRPGFTDETAFWTEMLHRFLFPYIRKQLQFVDKALKNDTKNRLSMLTLLQDLPTTMPTKVGTNGAGATAPGRLTARAARGPGRKKRAGPSAGARKNGGTGPKSSYLQNAAHQTTRAVADQKATRGDDFARTGGRFFHPASASNYNNTLELDEAALAAYNNEGQDEKENDGDDDDDEQTSFSNIHEESGRRSHEILNDVGPPARRGGPPPPPSSTALLEIKTKMQTTRMEQEHHQAQASAAVTTRKLAKTVRTAMKVQKLFANANKMRTPLHESSFYFQLAKQWTELMKVYGTVTSTAEPQPRPPNTGRKTNGGTSSRSSFLQKVLLRHDPLVSPLNAKPKWPGGSDSRTGPQESNQLTNRASVNDPSMNPYLERQKEMLQSPWFMVALVLVVVVGLGLGLPISLSMGTYMIHLLLMVKGHLAALGVKVLHLVPGVSIPFVILTSFLIVFFGGPIIMTVFERAFAVPNDARTYGADLQHPAQDRDRLPGGPK
ncbi:unnamed protein product [Amoebophrya sp. A120]|nr:unnamed protein product [Amoebophrya sp. A120]|eukprot:GSA120T00009134001.1